MKITLESTEKHVELQGERGSVPARVWEGFTSSGIPVQVFVTRIAVRSDRGHDLSEFERELKQQREPSSDAQAWPLRLLL